MSATNRGTIRQEAVYNLLDNYHGIKSEDIILEPSAGNGNIIRALRNRGFKNRIDAIELRETEKENLIGLADNTEITDFLGLDPWHSRYNVIIGNPPYSLAQQFIDKSLDLLTPGGRLIFLLRTNFLESKKRFNWWQDKLPNGLYVLHQRPSFTGKGTDATSYSWFIWEKAAIKNEFKRYQEIRVI